MGHLRFSVLFHSSVHSVCSWLVSALPCDGGSAPSQYVYMDELIALNYLSLSMLKNFPELSLSLTEIQFSPLNCPCGAGLNPQHSRYLCYHLVCSPQHGGRLQTIPV
jgi:hypothetical protein